MAILSKIRPSGPHHYGPIYMWASLACGISMAIIHHLFYKYWDGKPIDDAFSQKWVNRFGTAFAFLTKTSLAVAVGIAYVQKQWLTLHHENLTLSHIDLLFGALSDSTSLINAKLWCKQMLLFLLAVISWLLPLAAVVTPGALTITITSSNHTSNLIVPQLSYNASNFANIAQDDSSYLGPTIPVLKSALASATLGSILGLSAPAPNSSYELEFFGPSLNCSNLATSSDDTEKLMYLELETQTENVGMGILQAGNLSQFTYISWVPGDEYWDAYNWTVAYDNSNLPSFDTLDVTSTDTARIIVADYTNLSSLGYNHFTGVVCRLVNASYHTKFLYTSSVQTLEILSLDLLNPVPGRANNTTAQILDSDKVNTRVSYAAVMDAFGRLFAGVGRTTELGTRTYQTLYDTTKVNMSTTDTLRQGLQETFQNITLSLFGNPELTIPINEAEPVPVLITAYHNVYSYNAIDLLVSYGIAIASTLFSVTIGLSASMVQGTSYSNKFSTVLRFLQHRQLEDFEDEFDDASNPLPRKLAIQKLRMNGKRATLNDEAAASMLQDVVSEHHVLVDKED